jgi:rSAM/selenodomain-associated transferase 2
MEKRYALSIIIPTFNEAANIATLISFLQNNTAGRSIEVIVIDGGSTDDTVIIAAAAGALVAISPKKGRSRQMNHGASLARSEILYFLHADCLPPPAYGDKIRAEIKKGYSSGCFRLQFHPSHWFLRANAWFTRFDCNAFRFGDQSLFVLKDTFAKTGGFDERLNVMEDQEIIHRLKKYGKFKVMPYRIVTSSRKYAVNGIYKMQGIFFLIYFLYQLGMSQNKLTALYRRLIKQHKMKHEAR